MHNFRPLNKRSGAGTALLVLVCLVISLLTAPAAAEASFQDYADRLASWNVMRGYADGDYRLDAPVTRAQFVAMVNRAYGYTQGGPTPFQDVYPGDWYAEDIAIAYTAGYFSGTTESTASPNDNLSREQALVLLARGMRLQTVPGEVTDFTDGNDFASFSKSYVNAAVKMGIISGYPDGTFRPKNPITRGQMAKILANSLGTLIHEPGTHVLGDVYGNVTVNTAGVDLKDTTITGNLYISGGLDLGAVALDNVRVLGDIIVAGGGESEGGDESVILRNVEANNLVVDNLAGQYVSLRAEGDTVIQNADIRSDAYILDRTKADLGLLNITLNDPDGDARFTLSGNLKNVVNKAPDSSLNISRGTLQSLTVDEMATDSALNIDTNTTVKDLNLDTGVRVTGAGDVGAVNVNAAGVTSAILPDKITIRPGVTSSIAGEVMDTKLGEESSAAPRLLAGYPKVTDVAPTSASAVFSGNKKATVYWAVSALTDGSIGEDELVKPAVYGSKAVKYGNVGLTASNQEVSVPISGLAKGGSYYLSAIMVDARGTRSPLKVISFSTPDDTVPNFTDNTPRMSLIWSTWAQAEVKPTKDCKLYYALFSKGSVAPTPTDFRTSSLSGSLDNGVMDVTKNTSEFISLGGRNYQTNQGFLEELATYDLYVWLSDADNGKSSAVRKVTFTTVDKTNPRFINDLRPNDIKATSVSFLGAINEPGTIYWVVVAHDSEYPKPAAGSPSVPALSSEQAKFQVAQGLYALKSGKVSARGDAQFTINASGLKGETAYDLYYLAQDAAGNYSDEVLKLTFHTLDDQAPTVTQSFNKYEGEDASTPYAYTDVQLIFSEDVQQDSTTSGSLQNLYRAVENSSGEAQLAAKAALRGTLSAIIKLYDMSDSNNGPLVVEKTYQENPDGTLTCTNPDEWVIDYREAKIALDSDGRLVVTFPYGSGIRLSSGATYQFTVEDIADTSDAKNKMGLTRLDKFTTISSQVAIDDMNMFNREIKLDQKDADGNPVKVKVHGAVSLDPISTESVTAGKGWDLLIWTDSNLTLELYGRTHEESASGAIIGDPAWKYLDSQDFYATGAAGGFSGASLTYNFGYALEKTGDLNNFEDLRDLKEDTFYDFAFRITSLDGSTDSTAWSKTVNFRFNVVTGDGAHMSQMAHSVEQGTYNAMVPAYLSDITVPDNFELSAPFTDTEPPYFAADRPKFTPSDTYVDIHHQLNRDGTIYYVIAPIQPSNLIPTTWSSKDNKLTNKVSTQITQDNFETLVPEAGIPLNIYDDYKDINHVYFPIDKPSRLDIINPSFRNNEIKTGSFEGEAGQNIDRVTGLTKETDYICYFVLKGAGQVFSVPQAFRFKTTETQRPAVTLQLNGTTAVNIQTTSLDDGTYVPSTIAYALVRDDEGKPDLLNKPLTNSEASDATYLDAMLRARTERLDGGEYIPKGSYFDIWASEGGGGEKEEMQLYITGSTQGEQGSSGTVAYSENNISLANGKLDLNLLNKNMREGFNYILLVVASNDEGSGFAFAAIRGLHLDMAQKPQISAQPHANILGTLTDANKTEKVYGEIPITLNDGLYNYNQSIKSDKESISGAVDLASTEYHQGKTDGYHSIHSLKSGSQGLFIQGVGKDEDKQKAVYGQPVRNFTILFGYTDSAAGPQPTGLTAGTYTLTLTPYQETSGSFRPYFTAGANGGDTNGQVTITLTLRQTKQTITNPDNTTTIVTEWAEPVVTVSPNSWIGW